MTSSRRLSNKACEYCGTIFRPYQSSYRYCSISCGQRGRSRKPLPHETSPKDRFDKSYVDARCVPVTESGCHLWTGAITNRGYGQIKFRGRSYAAHRISYEVHNGKIPEGMCVMHSCDTPTCVNPHHLKIGTHAENMADRDRKGRNRPPNSGNILSPVRTRTAQKRNEITA